MMLVPLHHPTGQEPPAQHCEGVFSKIIGLPARHLSTVYEQQASGLARRILSDSTQAPFPAFERLPSGQ